MGRVTRTCRFCGVTFIGVAGIQPWADHTWSHWDELVESQLLAGIEQVASEPERGYRTAPPVTSLTGPRELG